ncbi:GIY-YIG nuclease family protein, partial [Vibrio parahaemolyticus]|nr:GIY-YIG nuclease family protein [Vibrio parahaemolyticus]
SREWFHVPLATVLEVIKHILDGDISKYRMDNTTGKVVKK